MFSLPDALDAPCLQYSLVPGAGQLQLGTKHSPSNTVPCPDNVPAPGGQLPIRKDKARQRNVLVFRETSRRIGHLCLRCSGTHHQKGASDLDFEEARPAGSGEGPGLAGERRRVSGYGAGGGAGPAGGAVGAVRSAVCSAGARPASDAASCDGTGQVCWVESTLVQESCAHGIRRKGKVQAPKQGNCGERGGPLTQTQSSQTDGTEEPWEDQGLARGQ